MAKYTAAFFRMSRSSVARLSSFFNLLISLAQLLRPGGRGTVSLANCYFANDIRRLTDHSQSITPASAQSNHPGQNFPGVSFAVYDSQAYRQISNSTQAIYRLRQCRRHQSTSMEEALSRSVPIAGSSLKREFARDRSGNPLWIDTAHLMSCRPMTPS